MRKGGGLGVACPRVPSSRAYGGGNGEGWGRGVAFPHVPPSRVPGGRGQWGRGCRGASCPDAPLHGKGRAGERGRAAAACPRTHPFCGNGRRGQGGRGGRGGVEAAYPCAHSFRANGKGGAGREGEVGGADRGQGEPGVTTKGQRRAHACPFYTARTWGKGRGGRRALVRRLSARTGWRGQRVREGGAAVSALVRPLSALERGGGQCGGKGRRGRGRLTPRPMKGKGWGVGLSSCVFSSTRMGRATGTEGGREGERRRGGDETSYRLPILYESGGTHN
ncbi:hypothetical protein EDB85DRAFT_2029781, partial [Lactarius pseudohatsudake]